MTKGVAHQRVEGIIAIGFGHDIGSRFVYTYTVYFEYCVALRDEI